MLEARKMSIRVKLIKMKQQIYNNQWNYKFFR